MGERVVRREPGETLVIGPVEAGGWVDGGGNAPEQAGGITALEAHDNEVFRIGGKGDRQVLENDSGIFVFAQAGNRLAGGEGSAGYRAARNAGGGSVVQLHEESAAAIFHLMEVQFDPCQPGVFPAVETLRRPDCWIKVGKVEVCEVVAGQVVHRHRTGGEWLHGDDEAVGDTQCRRAVVGDADGHSIDAWRLGGGWYPADGAVRGYAHAVGSALQGEGQRVRREVEIRGRGVGGIEAQAGDGDV